MAEEAEVTPHEQEMIDLVDNKEAVAEGQADPSKAPEYQEPAKDEQPEEIDYKAEYEKLKELRDSETETPKDSKDLGIDTEDKEPSSGDESPGENDAAPQVTAEVLDKYTQEFSTDGSLSEASYNELQALGLSKEIVDGYIQGQTALQETQAAKVYDTVGGAESYQEMLMWAKDNWSEQQIEVFNSSVNSGNDAQVMFGVEALATQFKAANGSPIPNRTLRGNSGSSNSVNPHSFESKSDMYKAMNDSLYGKDAGYTNMVAQKIANSKF